MFFLYLISPVMRMTHQCGCHSRVMTLFYCVERLMNVADGMGSWRDKGADVGQGVGLVLVLVATRASGDCVEQPGRTPTGTSTRPSHPLHPAPCPYRILGRTHPNGDKHQAPSSTPPRPLSLQDLGPQAPQWIGSPDSVVNIHLERRLCAVEQELFDQCPHPCTRVDISTRPGHIECCRRKAGIILNQVIGGKFPRGPARVARGHVVQECIHYLICLVLRNIFTVVVTHCAVSVSQ